MWYNKAPSPQNPIYGTRGGNNRQGHRELELESKQTTAPECAGLSTDLVIAKSQCILRTQTSFSVSEEESKAPVTWVNNGAGRGVGISSF